MITAPSLIEYCFREWGLPVQIDCLITFQLSPLSFQEELKKDFQLQKSNKDCTRGGGTIFFLMCGRFSFFVRPFGRGLPEGSSSKDYVVFFW